MKFHAYELGSPARPNFASAITSEPPVPSGGFSVMRALYRSVSSGQSRNPRAEADGDSANGGRSQKETK